MTEPIETTATDETLLPGRWLALGAFALLVVTSQLLWLTFAAVTAQTGRHMGVSEGAVGDLAVVNAAVFVLLAIPAGRWMDRNYAGALAAGAVFTVVGAVVRLIDPSSYALVFAGQAIMSLGQPLTLNASTKIAARYFPAREQITAISIASAAQFVGILGAVLGSKPLLDAGGFELLLAVHAGFAAVAAIAVLASLRLPSLPIAAPASGSLAWLRGDRLIWKMAAVLFVGFGCYNALATWLDAIMVDFGHKNVAGPIIAVTTIAGIVGAAVLPGVVAARDARRTIALATTSLLALGLLLIVVVHAPVPVGVILAVAGFVMLGNLPVILDWSELHVGPERAGVATGFLLLAGNVGAVVVVLTVQIVIDHPNAALIVMALWSVPAFLVALTLPRHVAGHE